MTIVPQLDQLAKSADSSKSAWVQHYLGSDKKVLGLKTQQIGKLAREIMDSEITDRTAFFKTVDHLYEKGTTWEELFLAAVIFGMGKKYRTDFDLSQLDSWLSRTVGWAQVDTLCQSNFEAEEVLRNWTAWEKFLTRLSRDKNINKRRASIVLLCKTLGQSSDPRPLELALKLVGHLSPEKEVLITKAVSWVLRSAVKNHGSKIEKYLAENKDTLPKIAYREAYNKLTTGRKN